MVVRLAAPWIVFALTCLAVIGWFASHPTLWLLPPGQDLRSSKRILVALSPDDPRTSYAPARGATPGEPNSDRAVFARYLAASSSELDRSALKTVGDALSYQRQHGSR